MSLTPTFRAYKSQDGNDYVVDAGGRLVVKAGGGVLLEGFYERLDVPILGGVPDPDTLVAHPYVEKWAASGGSTGVMTYTFDDPDTDEAGDCSLFFSGAMPHRYQSGTPILPVLWWTPYSDDPPAYGNPEASPPVPDDPDEFVSWEFEIYFSYPGTTPGGSPGWPLSDSLVMPASDQSLIGKTRHEVYATTFQLPSLPYCAGLGATFQARLTRTAITDPGTNFAATIAVVGLGLYYPVDSIGSAAVDSKF